MEVGAVSETGSSSTAVAIVDGLRVRVNVRRVGGGVQAVRGQHAAQPREQPPRFTSLPFLPVALLSHSRVPFPSSAAWLQALVLQCRKDSAWNQT